MNEDIYDNKSNVKFGKNGAIIVIQSIFPGDEILVKYGSDYLPEWNWLKQESLSELSATITDKFKFVNDLPNILADLAISKSPIATVVYSIIEGTTWSENLHSLSIDPKGDDVLSLGLFLTAGTTFEKYRFGGWGSGKTFPEVLPKRGQLGFFCDSWNGVSTAIIPPDILLSPSRNSNGPIRNLLSSLKKHYASKAPSIPPAPTPPPMIPDIHVTHDRVTLSLDLGSGIKRTRKIEDLCGCETVGELINYLLNAYMVVEHQIRQIREPQHPWPRLLWIHCHGPHHKWNGAFNKPSWD
jgi:hypothetical protein